MVSNIYEAAAILVSWIFRKLLKPLRSISWEISPVI
jgi:hypothetical protein